MAENAAAVETVEAMQSVVGQPVVALAQTQNLDYIENVDQSNILTGILYGIKANQEVLQRIEDNTANQTQALEQQADITANQTQALEQQADIQEEQIREAGDVAGETALEQPAGGGILTDAFKEKIGNIKDIVKQAGGGIANFGRSIGGLFGPKGMLLVLGATFFALKDKLPMVTGGLTNVVKTIQDKIIPPIMNLWENILKPFITKFVDGFLKSLPNVLEGIGTMIDGLVSILTGDFKEGFKQLFSGAGSILKGGVDFILNFFGTSTDELWASTKQFFTDILEGIKAPFIAVYDFIKPGGTGDQMLAEYIYEPIENFIENVKTFFTDLWDGAVQAVKDTFAGIGNFFSNIVDRVKTSINSAIDSLPLPKFIKDKLKLETKATREADERITETGIKGKYVDESVTGMERERRSGGDGALTSEAAAEVAGEGYYELKMGKLGEQLRGILSEKELKEFQKLDEDEQLDYLREFDEKEFARRRKILDLNDKEYAFQQKLAELRAKGKARKPEFGGEIVSPDDQLLMDNEAYANRTRQMKEDSAAMQRRDEGKVNVVNTRGGDSNVNTANNTYTNIMEDTNTSDNSLRNYLSA